MNLKRRVIDLFKGDRASSKNQTRCVPKSVPKRVRRLRRLALCGLAAVILLLPAGCGGKARQAEPVTEGFRCTAEMDYSGQHYVCELTCPGNGGFTAKLSQPALLDGLTMNWDGEGFTLSYLGIERRLDGSGLPDTAFAAAVRNALQSAAGQLMDGSDKGGYVLEGGSDSGDYTLTFSSDGYPATLVVPALDLNVSFRDFEAAAK